MNTLIVSYDELFWTHELSYPAYICIVKVPVVNNKRGWRLIDKVQTPWALHQRTSQIWAAFLEVEKGPIWQNADGDDPN